MIRLRNITNDEIMLMYAAIVEHQGEISRITKMIELIRNGCEHEYKKIADIGYERSYTCIHCGKDIIK